MVITKFTKVTLQCAECQRTISNIPNPGNITAEDAAILNLHLDQTHTLSKEEATRLTELLGPNQICPEHGRNHLGYLTEFTAIATHVLDITLDPGDGDGVELPLYP